MNTHACKFGKSHGRIFYFFSIAQLLVRLLLATVLYSFFLHNKSTRSAKLKWKHEKQNGRNETYRASIFVESDKYEIMIF